MCHHLLSLTSILQFNRPLTLVKETIQTRNRKSTGKSKKKSKKSISTAHIPLTPPLSAGLVAEGAAGNVFSGQISPCNYILAAPTGYEQPGAVGHQHYGSEYSYATPISYSYHTSPPQQAQQHPAYLDNSSCGELCV